MDRPTLRPVSIAVPSQATRTAGGALQRRLAALYARAESVLTLEVMLYTLFVLVAVVTRFWDLGSRPLHHDESLHAYFSWQYYTGRGYVHDPMMHGPLLFHMTALAYALFGDTEYVARVVPALFGTITVGLPYLLRQQLGWVSMLVASFLLLISPLMWYYGRFIRNEAWCVVFTMLIFIGVVRWMDSHRSVWLHVAWVNWVLLYSSKEISFIVLFAFVTFGVLALGLAHSKALLGWLGVLPVGVLAGMVLLPKLLGWRALPAIPFENPNVQKSLDYARAMLSSPQVLTSLAWTFLWTGIAIWLLRRANIPGQFAEIRAGGTANPLSRALAFLPRKWTQVGLLAFEFLVIAVPLHTSLFTNVRGGLMSGSFGQLFYWLAQQEVERGEQPWYYYFVLEPVYEPVAVLVGSAALLWSVLWAWRWVRSGRPPLTLLNISFSLVVHWLLVSLAVYSWAGEKMPWLGVHIALPLIFLASVWGTRTFGIEQGWQRDWSPKHAGRWAFVGLSAAIIGWTVLRMAPWSLQPTPEGPSPLIVGLLLLLVTAAGGAFWLGPRVAGRSLALLIVGLLGVYTLQSALQLSYENGAVPVEQAVYVQSSPRVTNVMDAILGVSESSVGGQNAAVIYDATVAWPFVWYLRDYPNSRYAAEGPESVPKGDVQFVLVGADKEEKLKPLMRNYTAYRYPMRWWFPEEMYRRLVPKEQVEGKGLLQGVFLNARYVAGGIAALRRPEPQAQLWRYLMYRRPDGTLNSTDMILYVRNDLVGRYNSERL